MGGWGLQISDDGVLIVLRWIGSPLVASRTVFVFPVALRGSFFYRKCDFRVDALTISVRCLVSNRTRHPFTRMGIRDESFIGHLQHMTPTDAIRTNKGSRWRIRSGFVTVADNIPCVEKDVRPSGRNDFLRKNRVRHMTLAGEDTMRNAVLNLLLIQCAETAIRIRNRQLAPPLS